MDLFKLLGTIAIDNSGANKALDETSDKAQGVAKDLDSASESGENSGGKFGQAMSKMGSAAVKVGKVVGAGMIAAGTAVAGLVTKSVSAYANYEQLVGGVETLFKDSADIVMQYADNAYKTAGMSANAYMETVTSFSASLLQGLDGDTVAAAEIANRALTDMSDNANKMGTDMTMIQNAYQGFAKQNYTMLDNLKLGYGGTQGEMARLINDSGVLGDSMTVTAETVNQVSFDKIIEAIGVVQDRMGITGTTALEAASTISGSVGMMKASWENLMTAMSDKDADFGSYIDKLVDSVVIVGNNLLPVVETALGGVIRLIDQLAPVIIGKIPGLLETLLPSIVNAATGIINAFVGILPDLVTAITDMLPALISGFVTIINGLVQALPSVVQALVSALPTLLPALIEGLTSMFVTLVSTLPQIIQPLLDSLPGIITLLIETLLACLPTIITAITMMITELINMLPQVLPAIIQGIMSIITMIIDQLPVILPQIVNAVIMIITLLGEQLPVLIPMLVQAMIQIMTMLTEQLPVIIPMVIQAVISIVQAIIENLPVILQSLLQALPAILQAVWDAIVMVFENLPKWFEQLWQGAVELCKEIFTPIGEFFSGIWEGIKNTFAPVTDFFSDLWGSVVDAYHTVIDPWIEIFTKIGDIVHDKVIQPIKTYFSDLWNKLSSGAKNAWSGVKEVFGKVTSFFGEIFGKAWSKVKEVFSTGGKIFDGIKEGIVTAFTTVVNAIIRGINKVVKLPFQGLNGILDRIAGIEIVGIKPFDWLTWRAPIPEIPELAEGGVLRKGQTGYLEGDGDEAVVPLERNTGWMKRVAANIHDFMLESADAMNRPAIYSYPAHRIYDQSNSASARAEVEAMRNTLEDILDRLDRFFPEALDAMGNPVPAVIGVDQAADALADPINYRLGVIAARKERGR